MKCQRREWNEDYPWYEDDIPDDWREEHIADPPCYSVKLEIQDEYGRECGGRRLACEGGIRLGPAEEAVDELMKEVRHKPRGGRIDGDVLMAAIKYYAPQRRNRWW